MSTEIEKEEGEVSDWESDVGNSVLEESQNIAFLNCEDIDSLKKIAQSLNLNIQILESDLQKMYTDFGISTDSRSKFRFDALYFKGETEFEEKDVLQFLQDCEPCSAYLMEDASCVVVFKNRLYAILTVLKYSSPVSSAMEDESELENIDNCRRLYIPNCGGFAIRFAKLSENFSVQDISFSTEVYQQLQRNCTSVQSRLFDKHKRIDGTKNPWGDLSKRWGVFDHQEIYGPQLPPNKIISSKKILLDDDEDEDAESNISLNLKKPGKGLTERLGKRTLVIDSDEVTTDDEDDGHWTQRNKHPRMRMRADDEQEKSKKKTNVKYKLIIERSNDLCQDDLNSINEINNHVIGGSDIYTRLGSRENFDKSESSNDSGDSYSEDSTESEEEPHKSTSVVVSRIQKVQNDISKSSNVWSRLDKCQNSEKQTESDLRTRLNKVKATSIDPKTKLDLREKLDYKKDFRRSPLRIEIDNDYCS